jgi:hypothetical protein
MCSERLREAAKRRRKVDAEQYVHPPEQNREQSVAMNVLHALVRPSTSSG